MNSSAAADATAPVLPGYRYIEQIGAGGYSRVYLYEQELPRRKVAIKVLNESALPDAARRRFAAEANAMAGLADHPSIVQVFGADLTADGRPYLVMQYYPQPNLSIRARREQFSVADVLRIGIQIGSAVETAHRSGILHRDIKPHNILTGNFDVAALTDFGIATTKEGADGGPDGVSVPWSPPELLYGTSDGDERCDVYSLGATLWHLLAGRSPFEDPGGDNGNLALMRRIQSDPVPPCPRRDVPDSLDRLLRQAMAKEPAARPQTALDLVRGLQAIEQEQRLTLTPIHVAEEPAPARQENAGDDGGATIVRDVRKIDPRPPGAARGSAADAGTDSHEDAQPTRRRRVLPASPAAQEVAGAAAARQRQLPQEVPAGATATRPAEVPPAAGATVPSSAGQIRSRSRRVAGAVIGAVLAIVVIVLAVAFSRHGNTSATGGTPATGQHSQNAIGPGGTAPGTPVVVVARAGPGELRFRWTYANAAHGDVFRWHRVSGGSGPRTKVTSKQVLLLAVRAGQSVCITVQVIRADGQASDPSAPACGS